MAERAKTAGGYAVMDKAWENIQKKTFTKWVNSYLAKRAQKIDEISTDFSNGLKLISFLEILSSKYFKTYEKNPKLRIQKIQNLDRALKFIKEQNVHLISIGAEDICDGNLKLILGMIWTIIQKFQIDDISEEELSAKEGLLLWCKKNTAGYRDCKVENFHTSWQDGMAFCALIHKHRPDLINYDNLKKENGRENLQTAFETAEKQLGIPQLLDVEDMVDVAKPDERSVMTYLSQYYHVFATSRKQEVAVRRIGKLVDLSASNEQLKADYTEKARKLVEWINAKTLQIKSRDFPQNLQGIRSLISDMVDYRNNEKPPKAAEKVDLEGLFNAIAMKLRANNRAPFVAPEGCSPSDIDKLWDGLGSEEREREDALRKELERQERLDLLHRRFNNKIEKLERWVAEKDKYLATDEQVDSVNSAKGKIKTHEAFCDEYSASKSRISELQELVQEMSALQDPDLSQVQDRVAKVSEMWSKLQGSSDGKKADLSKKLEIQLRMEQLRRDFSLLAKEYNHWAAQTVDTVNDSTFGDTLEAVTAYREELDSNDSEIEGTSNDKKAKLQTLWDEMQELGITDLKYTVLTMKDIDSRHASVLDALKRRREAYEEELRRQNMLEEKRKQFASVAKDFVDHLAARQEAIGKLQGEPEELIEQIRQTYNDGQEESAKLNSIETLSNEMSELGINENKHSEYDMTILSSKNTHFSNYVKNYIASLGEEQELKKEYVERAKELLSWIEETIPQLQNRQMDNTLEGARSLVAEFTQYKTGRKAETSTGLYPEIEQLYKSIETLLVKTGRPGTWNPPSGLALSDLALRWKQLEEEEHGRESALREELTRQEKLSMLVRRFQSDASDLERWAAEKQTYLEQRENIDSLRSAQFNLKQLEAYDEEFRSRQKQLQALNDLHTEIVSLRYVDSESISKRYESVASAFTILDEQSAPVKRRFLNEALANETQLEALRVEYGRLAKDFQVWAKGTIESVDEDRVFTVAGSREGASDDEVVSPGLLAVRNSGQEMDRNEQALREECERRSAEVLDAWNAAQNAGASDCSRHSSLDGPAIRALSEQVDAALQRRRDAWNGELQRQGDFDGQRKAFALAAQELINTINNERTSLENSSSTEDPAARLQAIETLLGIPAAGAGDQPTNGMSAAVSEHLQKVTQLAGAMKAAGVYGNPYNGLTLSALVSRSNQHSTYVRGLLASLREECEISGRIRAQESELAERETHENLAIEFSRRAGALNLAMENAEELLGDPVSSSSIEEAERMIAAFRTFETQLRGPTTAEYEALMALAETMQKAGVTDFSGVTPDEISNKWNAIVAASDQRSQALDAELSRQKTNDALCVQFADRARGCREYLHSQQEALAGLHGLALAEQLAAVRERRSAFEVRSAELIRDLDTVNQQLEAAGVTRNPHSDVTMRMIESEFRQLRAAIDTQEKMLAEEEKRQKTSDVSNEQIEEFKQVFDHFDRDRSGQLSRLEFKACLQTLGDELTDPELDSIMSQIAPDGKISFQAFSKFMIDRTKDSDSTPVILESFKSLASDKEFITEEDLRRSLSTEKANFLMAHMPKYEGVPGGYDYHKWVQDACSS